MSFLTCLQPHTLHKTALQLRPPLVGSVVLAQAQARASRVRAGVPEVQAGRRGLCATDLAARRPRRSGPVAEPERREFERGSRLTVVLLDGGFLPERERPGDGSDSLGDDDRKPGWWQLDDDDGPQCKQTCTLYEKPIFIVRSHRFACSL